MTTLLRIGVLLSIACVSPCVIADEKSSQELRKLIDSVEPSVVAIVVSHNQYPDLTPQERSTPGFLGDYHVQSQRQDPVVPAGRDKLDLSHALSAAENTFGSGIVLDESGRVLTNYHLIQDAHKIFLRYSDGRGSYANIRAADARSDLAVLTPIGDFKDSKPIRDTKRVRFATVKTWDDLRSGGKANVFRGQSVVSLAHPLAAGFSDGKASASTGIISNVRRRATTSREEARTGPLYNYGNLLQTDARLAVGVSGGGLFNLDGELIGLLSATASLTGSETGGGYALPMDPIYRRIIDTLHEGREVEYGFLGVSPTEPMAPEGLRLNTVNPNTPAFSVNLKAGDIIQAIDGRRVLERDDLFLLVGGSLAGTKVKLTVQRVDQVFTVEPTLAKFATTQPSIVTVRPESVHGLRVDYSSLIAQQPVFFGDQMRIASGVLIRDLEPKSAAESKLKSINESKRLMITHVNSNPVTTPAEFYAEARKHATVKLTLAVATDPNVPSRMVTLP
ncbi:N/A [soil metagenome]